MATDFLNNRQVTFKCGALADIANTTTKLPLSSDISASPRGPALEPGKLSIAIADEKTVGHKAYLYFDTKDSRYAISGPIWWDDVLDKPNIASSLGFVASTKVLSLYDYEGTEISTETLPFVNNTGDALTGHLYFAGAKENSSVNNTSQIIFGTSADNHVALSSNRKALVINPTATTTTNQIVLWLEKASEFPKGIDASGATITASTFKGNLNGTANKAKQDNSGNTFTSSYMSYSKTDVTDAHKIIFSTPNGTTKEWVENDHYPVSWTWALGTSVGPTATIAMEKNGVAIDPIAVAAIPSATKQNAGIVTSSTQTFGGEKTFEAVNVGATGGTDTTVLLKVYGSINIGNDKVNLSYNTEAESLDFTFF